jgi:Fe-S-cluster containining protein
MLTTKLDCLACPSFCCYMGWVDVGQEEAGHLAKFLGITPEEFTQRHVIGASPAGEKLIKRGLQVCQFLGEDRKCAVYEARPQRCRKYHCWEEEGDNLVVYKLAALVQVPLAQLRDVPDKA